jgi:hypothetical protein
MLANSTEMDGNERSGQFTIGSGAHISGQELQNSLRYSHVCLSASCIYNVSTINFTLNNH